MIRSGEGKGGGRPGRGREGKEREGKGGEAAARPVRERPPTPRPPGRAPPRARARADCGPGSARGLRAAAPGTPRFRVVRPQPRPRRGGGGRALWPRRDPGSPPSGARTGSSHLHPPGARRPREGGLGAHGRAFQLFFEGLACPPRRKMPTEAAAGVGKRPPPRFRHLRNSGRLARIRDAPAADTLIKSCLSIFAAANANDQILCTEPSQKLF